ncbi:MAG: SIMPL domain-containing protein [Clostridia bacterium]|nr:SIMPL domain-containing protein [Clostridia bacterium]
MKGKILKRAFALGCLTLALFCVVKKEEEVKKPIVMKQMSVAEEVVEDFDERTILQSDEAESPEDDTLTTGGEELDEESDVVEYDSSEQMSVLVVGSAKTSVTPDSALIFARIESLDGDIDTSKENALATFDSVVSALSEKGIDKDSIKLERFSCSACYEFNMGKSITGYCTSACLSIEIPTIDSLEEYITTLTENGVCCVDNICYKVSDMEGQYNIALAQAVENARAKAEKMTGEAGLSLVKIKEEVVHSPMALARKCDNDIKLSDYIGKVDIEARVIAIFEK